MVNLILKGGNAIGAYSKENMFINNLFGFCTTEHAYSSGGRFGASRYFKQMQGVYIYSLY